MAPRPDATHGVRVQRTHPVIVLELADSNSIPASRVSSIRVDGAEEILRPESFTGYASCQSSSLP